MVDYKEMYLRLAGNLADTIEVLDLLSEKLKQAQLQAESDIIEE